jgi:HTH-type transcriptional regulator, glycine betaine synthesis regulator
MENMDDRIILLEARMRLIETGGRASQDFGVGRIVGQVLVYLYLQENACSLDSIGENLGLSKASVSIAVRQLEQLGLSRKVWKSGDKKNYYKSAENIAKALQQGVLSLVRQKIDQFGGELDSSLELIDTIPEGSSLKEEALFLKQRMARAKKLQNGLERILGNPLVRLLTGIKG